VWGSGDGAVFTINGPVSNVISRVTGGQLSTIHGLLKLDPGSTGSAPNFFFINPAGVTFGAGAVVDVPAALHISTANYLKFPDGHFHADTMTASTFSSAAPEAFGFLGTTRATVAVNGGASILSKSLHPISVVAGDVKVDQAGQITTLDGGDIRVVAMGKQVQEVPLSGDLPVAAAYGDLDILNGGLIHTLTNSLANAGKVDIHSGNFTIDGKGSSLASNSVGTSREETGNSGRINVAVSGNIKIDNGGKIDASTYSSGDAGLVSVAAGGSTMISNGGRIGSETSSSGNAGAVQVNAGSLSIDGKNPLTGKNALTGISSDANPGATGSAGKVEVTVSEALSLTNAGQISSSTWSPGNARSSGDAGIVLIDADSIKIDGSSGSGIFSQANGTKDNGYVTGNAGGVDLKTVGKIEIGNGGQISSSTSSSGDAGFVSVDAGGSITISNGGWIRSETFSSGNAGTVQVNAGSLSIDGRNSLTGENMLTGISSEANPGATGSAGRVEVTVSGDLSLTNAGQISSSTWSSGDAGIVLVGAGSHFISGANPILTIVPNSLRGTGPANIKINGKGSGIFSTRQEAASGTEAGPITGIGSIVVAASGNIDINNGGSISSTTLSPVGKAGLVVVVAGSGATLDSQLGLTAQNAVIGAGIGNITIDGKDPTTSTVSTTGIRSDAGAGNNGIATTGDAGDVRVMAVGKLEINHGGLISSDTFSSGAAGSVKTTAGSVTIDGRDSGNIFTGISSQANFTNANQGVTGNAGNVEVAATGNLSVLNDGRISSSTRSSGDAGLVSVAAGGSTTISNGGRIRSETFSSGNAGAVQVNAGSLSIDGKNPLTGKNALTGISSDANPGATGSAGKVEVTVSEALSLTNAGQISSSTWSPGNARSSGDAGIVLIDADSIKIDGSSGSGIFSQANGTKDNGYVTGNAGGVDLKTVGKIEIGNGGQISSSTSSSGDAGFVSVDAGGSITISNGGWIRSETFSSGNAGTVQVNAGSLSIDGRNSLTGENMLTGISSEANPGATGSAGRVEVTVSGDLSLTNAGQISSSTWSSGDAGIVLVGAGSHFISGANPILTIVPNSLRGTGPANIKINGKGSGIFSTRQEAASGTEAGPITGIGSIVVAASGNIDINNGGSISSTTLSPVGKAGLVVVVAGSGATLDSQLGLTAQNAVIGAGIGNITIDGKDPTTSTVSTTGIRSDAGAGNNGIATTGDAGDVRVMAVGKLEINHGGLISSDTFSSGAAGSVKTTAGSVTIDGRDSGNIFTGISSQANFTNANQGVTGNAGNVEVAATGNLSVLNDGRISSSTRSSGDAGSVKVNAATLTIDGHGQISAAKTGILSNAESRSSGQTGSVLVSAHDRITLANGGVLSIRNDATVANPGNLIPTTLTVNAPTILLKNAEITASSTGNVAASNVQANFSHLLALDNSGIITSANQGNGGSIHITGGNGTILLDNSQITTSVKGAAGNGGDIHLQTHTLIMETGFIQANTTARNASGGDVHIDVQALVPSADTLFIGGETPYTFQPGVFGFNVIQAAAPTGVSGVVQISTPLLDISGALTGLNARLLDGGGLGHHPCRITGGSSLVQTGRGGFASSARNLLGLRPVSTATRIVGDMPLSAGDPRLAFSSWGCARS
jgi:filamentous hemagglutinin family protein